MDAFKTIAHASEEEFVINRSRFIGRCFPIKTEEEALAHLAAIRKQHYDATHNCYAYRVGTRGETARFSDDGEPSGTAGMPMMEVLTANGVTNVLCIVTRYFGGILLGAGGLVRAYSRGAAEAVRAADVLHYVPGTALEFSVDYARYGAVEAFVRANAQVDRLDFAEAVHLRVLVEDSAAARFSAEIVERTDGRAAPVSCGGGYLIRPEAPKS
ncbi:MAG: YigZ family protein [Christensenellaceae bacterium]|nr:YigZ family protein [Christensenellaceae bacterium]